MANIIEKAEDYVSSATISMEMLCDKLFLAVERGGLIRRNGKDRNRPQVSKQFEVFRDQTRRHESIFIQVMEKLGLDPRYLSPAAKVAQQKADKRRTDKHLAICLAAVRSHVDFLRLRSFTFRI
jgi:hypothetical protein